ncbi:MAG: hypothetical protein MZV49_26720 [Rhodopseudomonas palustris]|nr:hypothetical protein [Rhodopseudomonas palustris]
MIDVSFDDTTAATPGLRALVRRLIRREWPYLLMLLLVLLGVGYTGFAEAPIRGYWVLLTPVSAAICIATVWPEPAERHERWRAIRTQALHWGAVLIAMELVFLTEATRMMTRRGQRAVGAHFAGARHIHCRHSCCRHWRIALVGLVTGDRGAHCIVLLERWAMFVLLLGAVAAAVIARCGGPISRNRPLDEAEPLAKLRAATWRRPRRRPASCRQSSPAIEPSVQPSIVPNAGPRRRTRRCWLSHARRRCTPPQNPRAGHTPDGGADREPPHTTPRAPHSGDAATSGMVRATTLVSHCGGGNHQGRRDHAHRHSRL